MHVGAVTLAGAANGTRLAAANSTRGMPTRMATIPTTVAAANRTRGVPARMATTHTAVAAATKHCW